MFSAIIDIIGIRCLSFISLSITVRIFVYEAPLLLTMLGSKSTTKSIAMSNYSLGGTSISYSSPYYYYREAFIVR